VGSVVLGKPAPASLGKPTGGDGAMGRYESIYSSRSSPYYLGVLERRVFDKNGKDRVVVKTIRVESPYFRTRSGITPQSSLTEIRRQYPTLVPGEEWDHITRTRTDRFRIYDDLRHGIAFEINKKSHRAVAIYVHTPNESLEASGHGTDDWHRVEK